LGTSRMSKNVIYRKLGKPKYASDKKMPSMPKMPKMKKEMKYARPI